MNKKIVARPYIIFFVSLVFPLFLIWSGLNLINSTNNYTSEYNRAYNTQPYDPSTLTPESRKRLKQVDQRLLDTQQQIQTHQSQAIAGFSLINYFLIGLGVAVALIAVWLFLNTKITYNGDAIKYLIYGRETNIIVSEIEKILIQTTTPLGSVKSDIKNINWRDNIFLYTKNGKEKGIKLYAYPKYKRIITDIVENNPSIKIDFYKNTVMDNLKNYKRY